MNITIIGSGNMGSAIGLRLSHGNSKLTIQDRTLEKAKELAAKIGNDIAAKSLEDGIDGDIVILALPYLASLEVAKKYTEQFDGKIVVDISNPVNFETFELIPPAGSSGAEEIAKILPKNTKVIKAFNTVFAGALTEGVDEGKKTVVEIAGDDRDAKDVLKKVVEESGIDAKDVGTLEYARTLEKTAQGNIKRMFSKKE